MAQTFTDPLALAEAVVRRVGKRVVLGLPLGLGKSPHLANALYALAEEDRSLSLNIFTALTLEAPRPKSDLERRFLGPIYERAFGGYPELAYARAQREWRLPPNVEVNEFFFQAGTRMGAADAQQSYIAANYTHAARYVLARGVNVVGQLVAARGQGAGRRFSLSCNTDTTLDLLPHRAQAGFLMVGQVNGELPFMPGEAELGPEAFDFVLDGCDFSLFAPPKEPVDDTHYATGFHVASLIPDGGCLQLGIGSTSDAVCQALIVRHTQPELFRETVARLSEGRPEEPALPRRHGAFEQGLYACTEMFVDGFLALYDAGILKREVDGRVLHGGFFLGPREFYRRLREMPEAERAKFGMTAISFTNQLYGNEAAKAQARAGARFANSAMMATLLGEAVSDGFEDGRVLSGVGGQYDFVAQAFALGGAGVDARSILTLNSTRGSGAARTSNIRFSYGHATIPRHLKDVFVTEYGVADLRGKTDAESVAAMLGLADARFQEGLLVKARVAGKIPRNWRAPDHYRRNTPEALRERLATARAAGVLPAFPFGTELTPLEVRLGARLARVKAASTHPAELAALAARGMAAEVEGETLEMLRRLDLEHPRGVEQALSAALVRGAA